MNGPDYGNTSAEDVQSRRITRKRDGCFTCRIRKKPCPTRQVDLDSVSRPCEACERLNIECLGYGLTRPSWMASEDVLASIRADIKEFTDKYSNVAKPSFLSFAMYYASDPAWRPPFPW